MNAAIIQATINNADLPIIQYLFERLKVKTTILEAIAVDGRKRSIPVEKSIPSGETHKAFMEMRGNRHSMKGYTDVNLMIKDILEEDEQ